VSRTSDGTPVAGRGTLVLPKITCDEKNQPVETVVRTWDLDGGTAQTPVTAAEPGQYRLSCTLSDARGHVIEGGHIFVARGERFTGAGSRFNDLEVGERRARIRPRRHGPAQGGASPPIGTVAAWSLTFACAFQIFGSTVGETACTRPSSIRTWTWPT
jgi:hypothetical protein